MNKPPLLLIDLPVYPKGILSLSLYVVASCLEKIFEPEIIDLNLEDDDKISWENYACVGIKVSAQNYRFAVAITHKVRRYNPNAKVLWGGEFPTMLPMEASKHADITICGLIENIASEFMTDWQAGNLKKIYSSGRDVLHVFNSPKWELLHNYHAYSSVMGMPLETSRGCTEKCSFCMVHIMQQKPYALKDYGMLDSELKYYTGRFVNIIDYNFGVSKEHVLRVASLLRKNRVAGWMAEMCIEFLDDDEILYALRESNCKIIYCGLETIDDSALRSIHKMHTNIIDNYERIIRKTQSYGIQIGAGFILGLENTTLDTFRNTLAFFQRNKLLYVKLTFLTYNPGSKAHQYMAKKGTYIGNDYSLYDGIHLSYLPHGVNEELIMEGAKYFIRQFYSPASLAKRIFPQKNLSFWTKLELFGFVWLYSSVYREWLKCGLLQIPQNEEIFFKKLLSVKYRKSIFTKLLEKFIQFCRSNN
ncbi:MAG: radical SAM protein [Chitinophagales bacterium]|nr:radical SAM protein [Chitinophagales bacterium]MDW8417784.1 B12-binding domain-containing radical SAM protein [Chitinophagales bacterium]